MTASDDYLRVRRRIIELAIRNAFAQRTPLDSKSATALARFIEERLGDKPIPGSPTMFVMDILPDFEDSQRTGR